MKRMYSNKQSIYCSSNKNLMLLTLSLLILFNNLQISFSMKLSSQLFTQVKSTTESTEKSNLSNKETSNIKVKVKENSLNKSENNANLNNNSKNTNKQDYFPGDPCPCASQMPSCCTPEFEMFSCECVSKPFCGNCGEGNLNAFSVFHDSMLKMAMKDAFNQQDLAQKAKLQVELFQKAQDFAKEVGIQEMKAKQYARVLNEATRKAQISRAMMFQAASQVRFLADKTLKAITPMRCIGPKCGVPGMNLGVPSMPNQYGYAPENHLMNIKQKLNTLDSLNNPTMSSYGSYGGYGEYSPMKEGYFKNSSYNGNSRESSYTGENNSYNVSAN